KAPRPIPTSRRRSGGPPRSESSSDSRLGASRRPRSRVLRRAAALLELLEARVRLRAKFSELPQDRLDVHLVLQVHLEVRLRRLAILHHLTVLAHDDERPLQRDENREQQVVEDER